MCFTIQVPNAGAYLEWHSTLNFSGIKKLACQLEKAPTTGQLHIQGYAEATNSKSFTWWKSRTTPAAHLEKRMGTAYQAWQYCLKDDTRAPHTLPFTYGEPPEKKAQGKRSDLTLLAENIAQADTLAQVITENPGKFLLYGRRMKEFYWFYEQERLERMPFRPLITHVYWGDTGTGKTRRAHHEAKALKLRLFRKPDSGNWFDGYVGQGGLLLDDFYGQISPGLLLKMLDGYPGEPLPVKGDFVYARYTHVWITSNKDPKEWWAGLREQGKISPQMEEALFRRFSDTVHFSAGRPWVPPAGEPDRPLLSQRPSTPIRLTVPEPRGGVVLVRESPIRSGGSSPGSMVSGSPLGAQPMDFILSDLSESD